jgi:predicted DNA-binding protein with PD1-like motif
MESKRCGSRWVVRVDKGEEVVATLRRFCAEKGIRLGTVSGIGAADRVTLGCFETATKQYHTFERSGDHEITALSGNVTTLNGETYLHLHVTLSDKDCNAFGGHLNSARISGTCELVLDEIDGEVDRQFNNEVGLNLLRLQTG